MKILAVTVLVVAMSTVWVLAPPAAHACSCGGSSDSLADAVFSSLDAANAVFLGEVVDVAEQNEGAENPHRSQLLLFKVLESWKGVSEPYITIHNKEASVVGCESPFLLGETYLVYAWRDVDTDNLTAHLYACGLTTSLANADDQLAILRSDHRLVGRVGMPRAGNSRPDPVLATTIATLVLGIGLFVSYRNRTTSSRY